MLGRKLRRRKASKAFADAAKRAAIRDVEERAKAKYLEAKLEMDKRVQDNGESPAVAWAWYERECSAIKAAHKHLVGLLSGQSGSRGASEPQKGEQSGSTPLP